MPDAFTEHGAIMTANVLVVRIFVRLRQVLATHRELAGKRTDLERRFDSHDAAIGDLIDVIRRFTECPPEPPRGRIGFHRP